MNDLVIDGCIRTISGHYLDFRNPNPDTITIEDIAHGLSRQPRFYEITNKS